MIEPAQGTLPVHGFVLVGGQSSRMGRDKATLLFAGQTFVELALEKLRAVVSEASLCGNREDLGELAPVVPERHGGMGPVAGIESGLSAARFPWSLFLPVDVPCVPASLLRWWAAEVLAREDEGVRVSCLRVGGEMQPAFCMLHRDCLASVTEAIERGERKLMKVFRLVAEQVGSGAMAIVDAEDLVGAELTSQGDAERWFRNLNTPEEFDALVAEHSGCAVVAGEPKGVAVAGG